MVRCAPSLAVMSPVLICMWYGASLPSFDQASWSAHRDRLEAVARKAAGAGP
jgi:hypothetical protein